MGSAPTQGSFEGRLGSSARRGAYVGPGMSGVYRVTRSRVTQAQSVPRSTGTPLTWIQPDDVELSAFTDGLVSSVSAPVPGDIDPAVWALWPNVFAGTSPALVGPGDGSGGTVELIADVYLGSYQFCRIGDYSALDCPQVEPDTIPDGMSVEYEDTQGYVVTADVTGQVYYTADPPSGTLLGTGDGYIVRLDDSHTGWPTPSDLAGGTLMASDAAPGSGDSFTVTITPDVGSRTVGVFAAAEGHQYTNTTPPPITDVNDIRNYRTTIEITCTYMYRPPRYRFV